MATVQNQETLNLNYSHMLFILSQPFLIFSYIFLSHMVKKEEKAQK